MGVSGLERVQMKYECTNLPHTPPTLFVSVFVVCLDESIARVEDSALKCIELFGRFVNVRDCEVSKYDIESMIVAEWLENTAT
jgi:hypothetical protein